MEYIIKIEPVIIEDVEIVKYNIYYTGGYFDGQSEFYAYDLNNPQTQIREEYSKSNESL